MIKIIKKENPKPKYYRISNVGCCEFIATEDEFSVVNRFCESYADMICPVCSKQFYGD